MVMDLTGTDNGAALQTLIMQLEHEKRERTYADSDAVKAFARYVEQTERSKSIVKRIACLNDAIEQLSKTTLVEGGLDHA